jgi:hypothetical protein
MTGSDQPLLEGVRQRNNAADRQHGITFGGGGHSRPSRQTLYSSGHKRSVLFMPADDQTGALIAQHIKGRHDLSTRNAENVFHVLLQEASDQ